MNVAEARRKWAALRAEIEKDPADKDTYALVAIMDRVFNEILPAKGVADEKEVERKLKQP